MKIDMKLRRCVHRKGEPFFFLTWDFLIGGVKKQSHGANFPFSMS